MPKLEITLNELLDDSNWAQVFADENAGNVDKILHVAPPGTVINEAEVSRSDVSQIIAAVDGEHDGPDWLGVFILKDGRYLVASGGCDYTGWDCQAGNNLTICKTLEDVLQFGLSDEERKRLEL